MMKPETIATLLTTAKSWLGTPHRNFMRVKGRGVDCVLLAVDIYQSAGLLTDIVLPSYTPVAGLYEVDTATEEWVVQSARFTRNDGDPRDGDLMIFKSGGVAAHVGVYITGDVWHSYSRAGVINTPYSTCKKLIKSIYSPIIKSTSR